MRRGALAPSDAAGKMEALARKQQERAAAARERAAALLAASSGPGGLEARAESEAVHAAAKSPGFVLGATGRGEHCVGRLVAGSDAARRLRQGDVIAAVRMLRQRRGVGGGCGGVEGWKREDVAGPRTGGVDEQDGDMVVLSRDLGVAEVEDLLRGAEGSWIEVVLLPATISIR